MKKMLFFFLCVISTITIFTQEDSLVVYNLKINEPIYKNVAEGITSKLRSIDKEKAKLIILEINSSSGKIEEAYSICQEFDMLAESGIPVYAYIESAQGAAALVAIACEKIYMSENAVLGDSEIKKTFGSVDSETLNTVKGYFREYAERHQYPVQLTQGFVDPSMEIREISYRGARQFKTTEEFNEMMSDPLKNREIHDKGIVVKRGETAVFTANQCKDFGICRNIYKSKEEMLKDLDLEKYFMEKVKNPSPDKLNNFLTSKWVRFLLLTIGLLGILIEIFTPGLGVPGIVGLSSICLFFIGGYFAGVTEAWEVFLFVLGLGFLAMEVFVIPGFGVAGISGVLCCFIGILLSLQSFGFPGNDQEMSIFVGNLSFMTFSLGINIVLFMIVSKSLPKRTPLGKLSLDNTQNVNDGYSVDIPGYQELQGKEGKTVSQLRPSGKVEIDGETYDVVCQGMIIEEGENVKVILVEGNRIIVEKADA